jgi:Fe-S cluster assembly protein SufD
MTSVAELFEKAGALLPSTRDEDWRFTSLSELEKLSFAPAAGTLSAAPKSLLPASGFCRLVFVDGRYAPEYSSPRLAPASILVKPGVPAKAAGGPAFKQLNASLATDGVLIRLPAGAAAEQPIHLHFVATPGEKPVMSHVRVALELERAASARVVEEFSGDGGARLTTVATDIVLAEGAWLEHFRLQRENDETFHYSSLSAKLARDSRFFAHAFCLTGGLTRNDVRVRLEGEGAECALNGLYLADGRQHVDNHTTIEHVSPHGTSRELYKGVLDGRARAVFNGGITVEPAAQKTDAQVYNKNLLLSEDGLVNTKPEFKINANDVQCKHGATIGQLSADALFYLRSRGLGAEEARRLLVYAFASEMIDKVSIEPLKEALGAALLARYARD